MAFAIGFNVAGVIIFLLFWVKTGSAARFYIGQFILIYLAGTTMFLLGAAMAFSSAGLSLADVLSVLQWCWVMFDLCEEPETMSVADLDWCQSVSEDES